VNRDKNPPPARRGALGKGISSLLGNINEDDQDAPIAPVAKTQVRAPTPAAPAAQPVSPPVAARPANLEAEILRLPISQVESNPYQPRKVFDEKALRELSASLKQDGLLQPIVVARSDDNPNKYIIVAGERRWRASKLAGFDSIPAVIKEKASDDMLRLALIENIQREDLNVIEEAEAYAALIKDYGLTQEQCADRVGKERSTVTNSLRLLSLPRELQDDIVEGRLTMGHGKALLSLDEKKLILRARDIVIKKSLSVRQTEQLCKTFGDPKAKEGKSPNAIKDEADLAYVTESLRGYLHTKVKIAGNTSRGKIEVSYFSAAELERILRLMGHKF
jgi:ParB family chromosome partitioning protein